MKKVKTRFVRKGSTIFEIGRTVMTKGKKSIELVVHHAYEYINEAKRASRRMQLAKGGLGCGILRVEE